MKSYDAREILRSYEAGLIDRDTALELLGLSQPAPPPRFAKLGGICVHLFGQKQGVLFFEALGEAFKEVDQRCQGVAYHEHATSRNVKEVL